MESLFLVVILGVMIVMMYFSTRKQKKAQQEIRDFRSSLQTGDEVMTGSGLIGIVESVEGPEVVINSEGSKSRWLADAITKRPAHLAPEALDESEGEIESAPQEDANKSPEQIGQPFGAPNAPENEPKSADSFFEGEFGAQKTPEHNQF